MSFDLTTQAINAALKNDWLKAISVNLSILESNPEDTAALNRLARAYKESGSLKLAKQTYRKVLVFDRFNPIAAKNLKLLESLGKGDHLLKKNQTAINGHACPPQTFLEEPGKTKLVNLVNLAPVSLLSGLSCGEKLAFSIKRRTVTVVNENQKYLGALPDDLSLRLIRLIKGGNRYEVFAKTVAKNSLSVFIREVYRSPRLKNQPAFPGANGQYYIPPPQKVFATDDSLEEEEKAPGEENTEDSIE